MDLISFTVFDTSKNQMSQFYLNPQSTLNDLRRNIEIQMQIKNFLFHFEGSFYSHRDEYTIPIGVIMKDDMVLIDSSLTQQMFLQEPSKKQTKPLSLNSPSEMLIKLQQEWICPISQQILEDPVITCDGYTYDKQNITKWFQKSSKSPMTKLDLKSREVIPNRALKNVKSLCETYFKGQEKKQQSFIQMVQWMIEELKQQEQLMKKVWANQTQQPRNDKSQQKAQINGMNKLRKLRGIKKIMKRQQRNRTILQKFSTQIKGGNFSFDKSNLMEKYNENIIEPQNEQNFVLEKNQISKKEQHSISHQIQDQIVLQPSKFDQTQISSKVEQINPEQKQKATQIKRQVEKLEIIDQNLQQTTHYENTQSYNFKIDRSNSFTHQKIKQNVRQSKDYVQQFVQKQQKLNQSWGNKMLTRLKKTILFSQSGNNKKDQQKFNL